VALGGIAGDVEQTGAALGGALVDPPALVGVERRRLGLELVRELRSRGWSERRYREWLGRVLREQLLRDPGPG